MNDQQTPEPPPDAPAPAPNLAEFMRTLEPYVPLISQISKAIEDQNRAATNYMAWLLVLVVLSLSFLAALAMLHGHVDTAEKIIIGLLSFLGGVALFGGNKK